jgi:hypothetical protein
MAFVGNNLKLVVLIRSNGYAVMEVKAVRADRVIYCDFPCEAEVSSLLQVIWPPGDRMLTFCRDPVSSFISFFTETAKVQILLGG